jgi:hypothetical protein
MSPTIASISARMVVSDLMADAAGCNAAGRKPQVQNPGKAPQYSLPVPACTAPAAESGETDMAPPLLAASVPMTE